MTHAGTALRRAGVVTAGGRVLNVTALGDDADSARDAAYAAAEMISFDGMQLRRDIAAHAAVKTAQAASEAPDDERETPGLSLAPEPMRRRKCRRSSTTSTSTRRAWAS